MAISRVGKLACLVLAFMLVTTTFAEATMTCSEVDKKLSACLNYLRKGSSVSSSCCKGVKSLNFATKTIADRQATCRCLKSAYSSISGINLSYASKLPSAYGVKLHYKISTSTNCSKVK
ncbi:non-specific lipid-transfer protein 1-like [Telopea speciosissima]|uniref:non-specific lipid-transfer protein 1-like n=1 Tax=Telopea speciosissima TaxID=54955 RepID=UPI001CC785FF|nr:non-specific lipid-transfer protein 1-like [Telopea speciosissima]